MINRLTLVFFCFFVFQLTNGQTINTENLEKEISKVTDGKNATIGISVKHIEKNTSFGLNDDMRFPMQSVFKFPQAIYALALIDRGILELNQEVLVKEEIASKFSNSPLKKKYGSSSFISTVEELIRFSVSNSDNLACDVLFELLGGPKAVDKQLKRWGYKDIQIIFSEIGMSKKINNQFKNYCSPLTMVQILSDFQDKKFLSNKSNELLMKFMIESPTSSKRLKGNLPENTIVAHKTGTGDGENFIYALNDVGIITLPDGNHLAIAIFIKNSAEDYDTTERLIAKITQIIFSYFAEESK